MPYIPQNDRDRFAEAFGELNDEIQCNGITNGELNYLMSKLAIFYVEKHGKSYNTLSDVVKAFECAKLEFVRRLMNEYEDEKARIHGDIYHGI